MLAILTHSLCRITVTALCQLSGGAYRLICDFFCTFWLSDQDSGPIGIKIKSINTIRTSLRSHRTTASETRPPYAPRSNRFGSEPPSVEDDFDVWRYAILQLHARNGDDDELYVAVWKNMLQSSGYMCREVAYTAGL